MPTYNQPPYGNYNFPTHGGTGIDYILTIHIELDILNYFYTLLLLLFMLLNSNCIYDTKNNLC